MSFSEAVGARGAASIRKRSISRNSEQEPAVQPRIQIFWKMGKEKRREIPGCLTMNTGHALSSVSLVREVPQTAARRVFGYSRREKGRRGRGRVAKRARKELIPQDVTSFLALAIGNSGSYWKELWKEERRKRKRSVRVTKVRSNWKTNKPRLSSGLVLVAIPIFSSKPREFVNVPLHRQRIHVR